MRHKVEGSGSCSGAMKEIFRKNLPPKKSCPCTHVVKKPGTNFVRHEWYLIPFMTIRTQLLSLGKPLSWLERFRCTFLAQGIMSFPWNAPETLHVSFISYPCFEVSDFLPNNLVQKNPLTVILNSVKPGGVFFQVGWSRVGSVSKASPFKEMMERTMTERERLAAERYFADRVLHGFARLLLRRDFIFSSWALQLEHLPGIMIIRFNWKLKKKTFFVVGVSVAEGKGMMGM